MADNDSEQERQHLAETYAGMTDAELQSIARDSGYLSDEAWNALEGEFARRQLSPEVERSTETPVGEILDWNELIVLRQFRDLPEALLAKGYLDSVGIESFLIDDNMARMNWFISNLIGGIKLGVRAQDAEVATDVLDHSLPESMEVEGVGTYEQPSCPSCGSLKISFEALNKPVAYTSAWLGVPIPLRRKRWKCNSCGKSWREEQETEE